MVASIFTATNITEYLLIKNEKYKVIVSQECLILYLVL